MVSVGDWWDDDDYDDNDGWGGGGWRGGGLETKFPKVVQGKVVSGSGSSSSVVVAVVVVNGMCESRRRGRGSFAKAVGSCQTSAHTLRPSRSKCR